MLAFEILTVVVGIITIIMGIINVVLKIKKNKLKKKINSMRYFAPKALIREFSDAADFYILY